MIQVQCPNCGGYRVTETKEYVSVDLGEKTMGIGRRIFEVVSFVILLIITFGLILLGLLFIPAWRNSLFHGRIKQHKTMTLYHYTCDLCGYKWSSNDSLPTGQVRPDLIAKGAQKIEEEEQQRQVAAAAFYLSQQQKK